MPFLTMFSCMMKCGRMKSKLEDSKCITLFIQRFSMNMTSSTQLIKWVKKKVCMTICTTMIRCKIKHRKNSWLRWQDQTRNRELNTSGNSKLRPWPTDNFTQMIMEVKMMAFSKITVTWLIEFGWMKMIQKLIDLHNLKYL